MTGVTEYLDYHKLKKQALDLISALQHGSRIDMVRALKEITHDDLTTALGKVNTIRGNLDALYKTLTQDVPVANDGHEYAIITVSDGDWYTGKAAALEAARSKATDNGGTTYYLCHVKTRVYADTKVIEEPVN